MHDLIEQMGREIVRQESIKDPGRRSRLSNYEDVYNVLNNNKGTDSVEGIMLDLSQIKRDLHLDADTFKKMPNIRFFKFYDSWRQKKSANVYVSSTLESFPNELRYLEWSGCPVKSLPPNFCAEKLVELSMPDSQVSKLWDGIQDLVNLKKINLRGCKQLVELPDFTHASNLEEVCLDDCARLRQIHPSILSSHKLETFSVHNCKELKSLKSKIHLKYLQLLYVNGCSSLKEFSVSSEELTSLNFNGTIIDTLHSSVGRLSKLVKFDLSNVRLEALPNELCLLVSLEKLNLEGCKQLIELPPDMKALSRLEELNLTDCCSLRSLPELPPSIIHLSATNCTSLVKLFHAKTVFSLNLISISFKNCERLDDRSFSEYVPHTMMGVAIRDVSGGMLQRKSTVYNYPASNGRIFYPGSKVPSWCKYQTRESWLTINAAYEPWHQIVGFILCCVVSHIPSQRVFPRVIRCLSDLVSSTHFVKATGWSSNHVCIWFGKVRSHHGLRAKNVTLKFSAVASDNYYDERWTVNEALQYKWEVIGCGVRPVYESDILDVFQNVDPEFQFFFDRRSLSQLRVDKFIFTLDEVKTRLIRKIEEERRKEESWSEEVEEESSSKDVYN